MILGLHGHLGDRVSALVDGQLSEVEADRAWAHVLGCPGCRRLVQRETWLKQRLSSMARPATDAAVPAPRPGLVGALYDVDSWATVDDLERHERPRRLALAAVGVGSIGAAVIGLVALTGAPAGVGERPPARQVPVSVSNAGSSGIAGPGASVAPASGLLRHRAR